MILNVIDRSPIEASQIHLPEFAVAHVSAGCAFCARLERRVKLDSDGAPRPAGQDLPVSACGSFGLHRR